MVSILKISKRHVTILILVVKEHDVGIDDIGQDVQAGNKEGFAQNEIDEEFERQLHVEPQVHENLSHGEIVQKHLALFHLSVKFWTSAFHESNRSQVHYASIISPFNTAT